MNQTGTALLALPSRRRVATQICFARRSASAAAGGNGMAERIAHFSVDPRATGGVATPDARSVVDGDDGGRLARVGGGRGGAPYWSAHTWSGRHPSSDTWRARQRRRRDAGRPGAPRPTLRGQ